MSKQKAPLTIPEDPQDLYINIPKKTKKTKHPTACVDKRRAPFSCGICGSENLINTVLVTCKKCGKERIEIKEKPKWMFSGNTKLDCGCDNFDYNWETNPKKVYDLTDECVDCGAVKGSICPSCKKSLWNKGVKKYCKWCGYRI